MSGGSSVEVNESVDTWFKRQLRAVYRLLGDHSLVPLIPASLAISWLAWRLFFQFSEQIWARQFHVDLATVNSWQLPHFQDVDGAEPQVLLGLVIAATVLLGVLAHWLPRASRRVRAIVTVVSSCGALSLVHRAHFKLPIHDVDPKPVHCIVVVIVAVSAGILLGWGPPVRRSVSMVTALLLIPVAFLPAASPSIGDASAILAPALRLLHGAAPRSVYMQYDYLPSLLAELWLWLGGHPMALFFAASASYYALLVALPVLARHWFSHPGLRGPLLVTIILVRIYAVLGDPTQSPQVSPFRLDLWILPVAVALYFGVRHWAVAATLGVLCFFSRSIGVLYLGGYALALPADFLAVRLAMKKADRPPWRRELSNCFRALGPNAAILLGCLLLTTWWLGSPISDAALLYRKLGVGQLKIARHSFYWWLLPLTALSGGLAFWKRGERGEKKGGAMLLTVGLLIASSIYFFGRSHENNLINLSVPFLLCFFLSLDIVLCELGGGARSMRAWQIVVSSALVGLCAFQYSGRTWAKVATQVALLSRDPDSGSVFLPTLPSLYCEEVAERVPGKKVYFFAYLDYWYYQGCNYDPPSYQQPMGLSILKAQLASEAGELFDRGYTIALVKGDGVGDAFWDDYAAGLSEHRVLSRSESAHFVFVTRGPAQRRPGHHRPRPTHGSH